MNSKTSYSHKKIRKMKSEPGSDRIREIFSKVKLFQGENPFDLRKGSTCRSHLAISLVLILFIVNITAEGYSLKVLNYYIFQRIILKVHYLKRNTIRFGLIIGAQHVEVNIVSWSSQFDPD